MSQLVPDSTYPRQVVSPPVYSEAYSGLIFGWRPPSSCYGAGTKTPQQQSTGQPCSMASNFLPLLIGAAVIGMVVRK